MKTQVETTLTNENTQNEVAFSAFITRSLRVKLVVAFLAVGVLSVGVMAILNNYNTSAILRDRVGTGFQSLADSQAVAIGDLLAQQVNLVQTLALDQLLETRLKAVNATYRGDPATIQARIESLDQQWVSASDTASIIQTRLNSLTASGFRTFRTDSPAHVEIFVTDQLGGVVAATNRISDYYQADEEWWQRAFNHGNGAIYVGQPEFDESSATFGINIAVPVYDSDNGEVLGILRTTYDTAVLVDLLTTAKFGQTGDVEIYLPGGLELAVEKGKLELEQVELSPNILDQLEDEAYVSALYDGAPSLLSQSPVVAVTGEPVIAELNWMVIVHQDEQEALAPVEDQTRTGLLPALAIFGLAAIGAVVMGQLLAGPITRLTAVVAQVIAGDLNVQARAESNDEIGQLAIAFNTMTDRLRDIIGTLEEQVTERTRRLETVVDVSRRLTGILDLSDLLRRVVTLTKETFNYYHVHIYLLEGETLIMAEGYGEAGAEMKRQGYSIPLATPQSLVARAAREGQVVTVDNVRETPDWLPNPLLPNTYSEMAVPAMLGGEVVGVLDVQSEKVGGLAEEDETTLQALANQVATAVRNARQFTETQEALYEAQRLQQLYVGQAWEKFGAARPTTSYEVRQPALPPLEQITTSEVMAALQQKQTVDLRLGGAQNELAKNRPGQIDGGNTENQGLETINALATPLRLRNQIIGVLGVRDEDPERRWTEDEIALIEAVSEQMSLAIENARLFDDTQRHAQREALTRQIADKIGSADSIEEILQTTVAELSKALGVPRAFIDLNTE